MSLKNIRAVLVRLQGDVENFTPGRSLMALEGHRDAVETLVVMAQGCDISGILDAYELMKLYEDTMLRNVVLNRPVPSDQIKKALAINFEDIETLVKEELITQLNDKCQCRFALPEKILPVPIKED